MPSLIALVGGNEFRPDCEPMDRTLLARAGRGPRVVILPTAAARENPDLAAQNGVRYFERLGARAEAAWVVDPASAREPKWASLVKDADLIYFAGGDPLYLLQTLLHSPLWAASVEAWQGGRMLAGSSAGCMIFGGKMWSPGEGWTEGLGLLPDIAVIPHHARLARRWKAESMRKALPAGIRLIGVDESTALVGPPWEVLGGGEVVVYEGRRPRHYRNGQGVEWSN